MAQPITPLMTPRQYLIGPVAQALAILPAQMSSVEAKLLLVAIAIQESDLAARRQYGNGPARGFPQFEKGSKLFGGGVWGVYKHKASRYWLNVLCEARQVPFDPDSIWRAMEYDDVLGAGIARLLLFTDPKVLPRVGDIEGAWTLYAKRTWKPGKPHRAKWDRAYRQAQQAVGL